ncbi:MAG: hypothetical protein N4A70_14710 [Pelagimonas sp.]|jgi:hypothetical protein|nr:hypothetical protein [Pelagimonas sp.]
MIKNVILLGACLAALAACTTRPEGGLGIETVTVRTDQTPADEGKEIPFSGDVLDSMEAKDVVRFNLALESKYQDLARYADQLNHSGNAYLVVSAAWIVLSGTTSVTDEVIGRRTVAALTGNEIFKYASPAELARALRIAAGESLCFADVSNRIGLGRGGSEVVTAAQTADGQKKTEPLLQDADPKSDLIIAMRVSHSNLRERMSRKRQGLSTLLNIFQESKVEGLEKEDHIALKNKVKIAESGKGTYKEALYKCLE